VIQRPRAGHASKSALPAWLRSLRGQEWPTHDAHSAGFNLHPTRFLHELRTLGGFLNRIAGFSERKESAKDLPRGSALVLSEIFLRGEIARGDVSRIIGASPRTSQKVTRELLAQRLVTSDSPKGLLRLGFPADAAGH
jgi:hypothetical protein